MRKIKNVITSLMLCIAIALSFSSCKYIDAIINKDKNNSDSNTNVVHSCPACRKTEDGYTGGFTRRQSYHDKYEMYWLETYDEVLEAVELLKSHGSTIKCSLGFNCEGEVLDIKFCFLFEKSKAEPLQEGKNFFDRKIDDGEFGWFGFYEYISIDDLLYEEIYTLDVVHFRDVFSAEHTIITDFEIVKTIDNVDNVSFYCGEENDFGLKDIRGRFYELFYNGKEFALLEFKETKLPFEYHREFLDTFVIIE